ncbi:signal peptidase I [Deltaproteobacteria bacterium Smac51]|nr:signal peptidase I [Deltaproteobacteria bacterium Smac51]
MSGRNKTNASEKPTAMETFKEYAQAIILAVVLALFVRSFVMQAFHIPSGSMIPTFLEGDRVLVNKFVYGIRNPLTNGILIETGQPERWDVVVFIAPKEKDKDFVKRVIGLPGETVAIEGGQLFINGVKMEDPHARYYNTAVPVSSRTFGPVMVKENEYFMMGDNRDNSSDSRVWGGVDVSLLKGKAWRLYWSWDSDDPDLSFFDRFRGSRIGTRIE